jgi:hypothetical protein
MDSREGIPVFKTIICSSKKLEKLADLGLLYVDYKNIRIYTSGFGLPSPPAHCDAPAKVYTHQFNGSVFQSCPQSREYFAYEQVSFLTKVTKGAR